MAPVHIHDEDTGRRTGAKADVRVGPTRPPLADGLRVVARVVVTVPGPGVLACCRAVPCAATAPLPDGSVKGEHLPAPGGKPGDYWGTELDFGATWKPSPGFFVDFECAYLFSGSALEDEHGDAVNSFYTNLRFTYAFGEEG